MVRGSNTLKIALVGIMAASIECVKLALAALPNIEAVTLLIGLYSYVFGIYGVLAALIFVMIEPLIWGFGSWVISYLIYWPTLGIIFALLGKLRVKNRFTITVIGVLMTFLFGVLTSLVDVGLFSGSFDNFLYRFGIYYARGIVFYAVQIGCNAVLLFLLFPFFARHLSALRRRMRI